MTPVRAPVITGQVPEKRSSGKGWEAGDDSRPCFLVTGIGLLRLGQDHTGSAVLAGVALLLSHRHHEPIFGGIRRRVTTLARKKAEEKAPTRRLGATLGATPTNDLAILRTSTDNGQELARGHELM